MTPDCKPARNGYGNQVDCRTHGTPWPCEVTPESWAEYVAQQTKPTEEIA